MGRNAKGDGSVVKSGGRYRGYVTVHGERRYFSATTNERAHEKRKALIALRDAGLDVSTKYTVATWLEHWLTTGLAWAPRYRDTQTFIVRSVLTPALGRIPLAELRPEHVETWISSMIDPEECKKRDRKPVTASTLRRYNSTLVGALRVAAKRGHVVRNAAELVSLPKIAKPRTTSYSVADTRAILERSEGDRMEARWYVALMLGVRPAEALGLEWESIDFVAGVVSIRQQLRAVKGGGWQIQPYAKSDAGMRDIKTSPRVLQKLREHRERQLAERRDSDWIGWDHDLVFASPKGTPIGDGVDTRAWRRALDLAGLPYTRRYQARHTAVTLQLKQSGQDVAVVAKNAGHADPSHTYRVYVHALEDAEKALAAKMDALLDS